MSSFLHTLHLLFFLEDDVLEFFWPITAFIRHVQLFSLIVMHFRFIIISLYHHLLPP